ncbi:hypothetical protein NP493_653g01072 [Ridgeia piscesae]|uniref:Uncharacterized protein n=1 Tax=Ridgeia piscesae TaxID=27915 RepID=A0AAD9NQ73_RIDPI|nr:hypothetical protein NP493_653g01072 [Ridgeia piscesae]
MDKNEWTSLCAKKMPLAAIRQLDDERAVAIDDALLRYTLPENVPRFDQFQSYVSLSPV